jgi:hypothetical protein
VTASGAAVDGASPGEPAVVARLRDGSPVAAWLLKARPSLWDIGRALRDGVELDWWRLAHTYRAELVHGGQPCAMWVTRGDPATPSGIWAIGEVTDDPVDDVGDPDDPLWRDRGAQRQLRPRVPVRLRPLARPLLREEFESHPDLDAAEILRVPRIGNPSALSPRQWQALQSLLHGHVGNTPTRVV